MSEYDKIDLLESVLDKVSNSKIKDLLSTYLDYDISKSEEVIFLKKLSIYQSCFENNLKKLSENYLSISIDDIQLIETITKKYDNTRKIK